MVAEFEVHRALVLEDRGLFALAGEVAEGTPRTGMLAALEGEEDRFSARVHGVEFVEADSGEEGGTEPALTFSYGTREKLERWRAMEWAGRQLRLGWGD